MQTRVHIMSSNDDPDPTVPRRTYCQHISISPSMPNGFKASAKIESVIQWFQNSVPPNEKVGDTVVCAALADPFAV